MREKLLKFLAILSISSARKKVYSQKAHVEKQDEVACLLQAIAESESVQARRLLNALRGQIDCTQGYLTTVFTEEVGGVIKEYESLLDQIDPQAEKAMTIALSQLLEAERKTLLLRTGQQEEARAEPVDYYVCQFCGYIAKDRKPENCPICKAQCSAFKRSG